MSVSTDCRGLSGGGSGEPRSISNGPSRIRNHQLTIHRLSHAPLADHPRDGNLGLTSGILYTIIYNNIAKWPRRGHEPALGAAPGGATERASVEGGRSSRWQQQEE